MVFIASFINKKAVWRLSAFDYACGALSVLGLILWAITQHGNVAIVCSIFADGIAAVPTLVKSYKEPESEHSYIFLAGAVGAIITLLTIDNWTFANYGFPIYIALISGVLGILIELKIGPRLEMKMEKQ